MATTSSSRSRTRSHGSISSSSRCRRNKNFVLTMIMAMVAVHVLVMMTTIILTTSSTSGSSSTNTQQQQPVVPELVQRRQQQQQQSRLAASKSQKRVAGRRRREQQEVIPQHAAPHRQEQKQQYYATKTTSTPSYNHRPNGFHPRRSYVLKAYLEEVNRTEWTMEPLPNRSTAREHKLRAVEYPEVNSCRNLAAQWPADVDTTPAFYDPFLPWIHDVFATEDGEYAQFVAQNIRRCDAGNAALVHHLTPAVANFQHVSVRRVLGIDGNNSNNETRYRLTNHSAADSDGVATRFICRFRRSSSHPNLSSPSSLETLSVFHVDYDWHAYRKRFRFTFKPNETSNTNVLTSQLTFACPIPVELRDQIIIRRGTSVSTAATTTNDNTDNDSNGHDNNDNDNNDNDSVDDDDDDCTNLFVDLIPIRTPPRFGAPHAYFQPRYAEHATADALERFDPDRVYGPNHVLPRIGDSGRWENIPVCKPHRPVSPSTSNNKDTTAAATTNDRSTNDHSTNDDNNTSENSNPTDPHNNQKDQSKFKDQEPPTVYTTTTNDNKKHRLIACLWASAAASSGTVSKDDNVVQTESQRRLLEWITYHTMIGFDHVYVYDNSLPRHHHAGVNGGGTLKPVTDSFSSEKVTYIRWPAAVCNNNDVENSVSPREWSSQSAAESSCRLRYGPAAKWIGQLDVDEYVVPAGNHTHLHTLLDELERSDIRILSMPSFRAKPRFSLIEQPKSQSPKHQQRGEIKDPSICGGGGDASHHLLPLHLSSSKKSLSSSSCFEVRIPRQTTFLQAYNCDVQLPNQNLKRDPAEKQLYRSDFVLQHYVHYATATTYSATSRSEQIMLAATGRGQRTKKWKRGLKHNNPYHAWANEETQALLLHTKTVEPRYTAGWSYTCSAHNQQRQHTIYKQLKPNQRLQERQLKWICHLGFPWPSRSIAADDDEQQRTETKSNRTTTLHNTATAIATTTTTTAAHHQQQQQQQRQQHQNATADGMAYNCHVHERIENYYVPRLERALSQVLLREQQRQQ